MYDYKRESDYFLKEAILLPDYVMIYRNEAVRWTEQIGFDGLLMRPQALFKEDIYKTIENKNTYCKIELETWFEFMKRSIGIFKSDCKNINFVVNNVNQALDSFQTVIENVYKEYSEKEELDIETMNQLFYWYSYTDAFSVFNNILPREYFYSIFSKYQIENEYHMDDFLISFVEPHRVLVRRKKIELALDYLENNQFDEERLTNFRLNYMPYDMFTEWLFDDTKLKSNRLLIKEIKSLVNTYSKEALIYEHKQLVDNRKASLVRRFNKMNHMYDIMVKFGEERSEIDNILSRLTFLSVVSTEEERRHMLVCKFHILLGRVLRTYKLDVARSSKEDILFTVEQENKGGKVCLI